MALIVRILDNCTDGSPYAHAVTNSTGPAAILGRGVDIPAANENAYIQIGAVNNPNTRGNLGFTVSQWIKLGRVGVDQALLNVWGASEAAGNSSWLTAISATNRIEIYTFSGAGSSGLVGNVTTLATARWYHFVCVYDGGTTGTNGHLYINGAIEREGTISQVPQQSTNYALRFGANYARDAASDFIGTGRDLRFYNDAKPLAWARLEYLRERRNY